MLRLETGDPREKLDTQELLSKFWHPFHIFHKGRPILFILYESYAELIIVNCDIYYETISLMYNSVHTHDWVQNLSICLKT